MSWLIMGGIPAVLLFFCYRAWRGWQDNFAGRDDDDTARFMLAMGADSPAPEQAAPAPSPRPAVSAATAQAPGPLLAPDLQAIYLQLRAELGKQPLLADVDIARLLPQLPSDMLPRVQADFVLCRRDFTPAVVILVERDGGSIAVDRAESLLRAQRLRVLRWRANALPDAEEIRAQVFKPRPAPASVNAA